MFYRFQEDTFLLSFLIANTIMSNVLNDHVAVYQCGEGAE